MVEHCDELFQIGRKFRVGNVRVGLPDGNNDGSKRESIHFSIFDAPEKIFDGVAKRSEAKAVQRSYLFEIKLNLYMYSLKNIFFIILCDIWF
jgi:hypothetical protein